MAWVTVGVIAGTALLGAHQAQQKRNAQERFNRSQAEVTRYSPWTGMKGEISPITDTVEGGALQGGLTGAAMAQSFKGVGDKGTADTSAFKEMGNKNGAMMEAGQFDKMKGFGTSSDGGAALDQMNKVNMRRGYNPYGGSMMS